MKNFYDILKEAKAKKEYKISAGENTDIATAGELLTAHHILNHASENHPDKQHRKYLKNKAKSFLEKANGLLEGKHPDIVADAHGRARAGADHYIKHHQDSGTGYIQDVHHTPKNGDIERVTGRKTTQTDDPSDIVTHFKTPDDGDHYHGISYKHNKSNTLGTPGISAIDKRFGTKIKEKHKKFQELLKKKYGAATKEQKKQIEKDPKVKLHATKFATEAADDFHKEFGKSDTETQREHLKSIFKVNKPKVDYSLLKVSGTGGTYKTEMHHHDDNHISNNINNAHSFSSERRGSTVHYFAHDEKGNKTHIGYSEHRFTHSGFTSFGAPTHSASEKKK